MKFFTKYTLLGCLVLNLGWLVLNIFGGGILLWIFVIHDINPHSLDREVKSLYCNNYNYVHGDIVIPARFFACTAYKHLKEPVKSAHDWMGQPL